MRILSASPTAQDTLAATRSAAEHFLRHHADSEVSVVCDCASIASDILQQLPAVVDEHYNRFIPSIIKISDRLLHVLETASSNGGSSANSTHHSAPLSKNE